MDTGWPSVTIVFLVYNRRDELRESLQHMLRDSDYPGERVDVIVVDNASTDGSGEMVREEFPGVRVITRPSNIGVSGWNDGLGAATGDYILVLDDDCFLPPDGLRRAVAAAARHHADLVSFRVASSEDPGLEFTRAYKTGLFMFWGCAALMRRTVVEELTGYDPEIFVLANELEFMLRFFDQGFRHLHLPDVTALHMKTIGPDVGWWAYRHNARHWGYIAAKLFRARDAAEALVALVAIDLRDWARRGGPSPAISVSETLRGYLRGLRRRAPLRNPHISRTFRRRFETFASPWAVSRSPRELARELPAELLRSMSGRPVPKRPRLERYTEFYERSRAFYPTQPAMLEFTPAGPRVTALHEP